MRNVRIVDGRRRRAYGARMELELILPVGRDGAPLQYDLAGELSEADIATLRSKPVQSFALARLTERHKAMARALVGGMKPGEVAYYFGVSENTVSRLQSDPAFRNLMDFFSRVEDEETFGTQGRLASVTNLALDRLEERLSDEEEAKKIPITQVLEIIKTGADRTGHGPQSSTVAVNINTNLAERMKAARERANASMQNITPKDATE